ncbi:hypothetical protein WL57_31900 [Burkholderia cepacia]|nr:hypothetical protein WL32_34630 [Burkholderia cepacia]KWC78619.1 hypothetical protein WL57_31900 [Burkholderia cepacia]
MFNFFEALAFDDALYFWINCDDVPHAPDELVSTYPLEAWILKDLVVHGLRKRIDIAGLRIDVERE